MKNVDHTQNEASMRNRRGFTLLEIIVTIVVLMIVAAVAMNIFSATLFAWKRSTEVAESMQHGDFTIEQLVSALNSTVYFNNPRKIYAFKVEKHDLDGLPADTLSFVTSSGAFMPMDSPYLEGPHRLKLLVDYDEYGDAALFAIPMPAIADDEEFEEDYATDPMLVSRSIGGLEILFWDNDAEDWTEEWEPENSIPERIQVTVYVQFPDEDEEPMQFTRMINVPVYESLKDGLRSPVTSSNNR